LTGTAGRWSATHPWTVVAAWLGCVVLVLLTGRLSGLTVLLALLGTRDWYLPRWLEWLPRISQSTPPPGLTPRRPVTTG